MKSAIRSILVSFVLGAVAISSGLAGQARRPVPTREEREALLHKGPLSQRALTAEQQALRALQDDVDITHYFLDLDFTPPGFYPQQGRVEGSVTITGSSLASGFDRLVLDFADGMTVLSVVRDGAPLEWSHADDLLDVSLDRTFGAGESFDVTVSYTGYPQRTGFGSITWYKYSPFEGYGEMVSTLSEPEGARDWWPCKDRPDDKATVEEWWTVPADWFAAGNGVLQEIVDKPQEGKKQYRWVPTHPLTTYLVSIAATEYASFSDTYVTLGGGTMPVDYYVYPEDLADAQESFSETVAMIEFFAQLFGEYPFVEDKYGMSAFPFGGAMEHSTNTSYGYNLITGDHQYDYIIAHELAHQWWGDSVSPENWKNTWLNEGFATHSEALWRENLDGAQAYRDYMKSMWREEFDGPVYDNPARFGTTVYDKGAWVQHMLRGVLGDTGFFGGLRDWYQEHFDGVGNTAQYQQTMEGRYGASLDWFFQEWVYGENSPRYEYGWTTADLGDGSYRNYVRIHQIQTDAGVFTMPVRLTLVTDMDSEVRTVWNDQRDQDFTLETEEPLTDLLFDEHDWILKASVEEILLDDLDGDGVPDRNDNCESTVNPRQDDADGDGSGDACDPDDDNDGLDDAADCAPFDPSQGEPAEVPWLHADRTQTGATRLTWGAAERADAYDVSRGSVLGLHSGDDGQCLASMLDALSWDDPGIPIPDRAWYYLVRGHDEGCGGGGSSGSSSDGEPRSSPCP